MKNGEVTCVAEIKGRYGIYLDNDSLIELSTKDVLRRQRFVCALRRGGTLLFSMTNAVEAAGLARPLRDFLDGVGSYWVPLEMDPWVVVEREKVGHVGRAPVSEQFMLSFDLSQVSTNIFDLSAEKFFRLSTVLDWVQDSRKEVKQFKLTMYDELCKLVTHGRAAYESDRASLDRFWPPVFYDDLKPATFVLHHLLRLLIVEAKSFQLEEGDGLDFCHAVMAASYGSIATLDKGWKRRVENLPKPNRLAKVYYRPEVDQLVDTLEELVASLLTKHGDNS